jgi:antitoxin (DNA-binding transcriptional repressor) of toxin-antitoxin stability system
MSNVGVYEAKLQLSRLLKGVQQGKRYTITNGRVPVADLVPHAADTKGAVLLDQGAPPSKKLRELANRRLTKMRRQRGHPGFNLERFIDKAREG